jgi:hypothetical protein
LRFIQRVQGRSYGKRQTGNNQLLFFGDPAFAKRKAQEVVPHRKSYAVYPNMLPVSPSITLSNANVGMACKRLCRTASTRRGSGSPSADNKHMLYDGHDQYDGVIGMEGSSDHD